MKRTPRWNGLECFFLFLALGGLATTAATPAASPMKTYTYKTVGSLEIKADVYRAEDEVVRPVLVWIHGGALIMGGRQGMDRRINEMFLKAGYAIVSIDYRLAPETKLPEILEDVQDALKWIHEKGPRLLRIDPNKLAVMGGSAGGYLTLATGHRIEPPPQTLVAFYGYGDLIGDWYSKPSPHPRHHKSQLSEAEARRQVQGPAIANGRDRQGDGGAFYQFCRQRGLWPLEVSGWDPQKDHDRFTPYMPVRNVTEKYPPTLLIHGTADTDVPYEQSTLMAEQLKQHQVPFELITIDKAEHGLSGGDNEEVDRAYQRAFEFIQQRISK